MRGYLSEEFVNKRINAILGGLSDTAKLNVKTYEMAIEDVENREFIIEDIMGLMYEESVLATMKREIANETIDAIRRYMDSQLWELIVSLSENEAEEAGEKEEH